MQQSCSPASRCDDGFTLTELLVVIVILGVLAAIVVLAVGGVTDTGRSATCRQDRKTIETAVGAYFAQHGSYPSSLTDLQAGHAYLSDDANITPTAKVANGYRISYDPASGTVSECQQFTIAGAPQPVVVLGCTPGTVSPGPGQQLLTISGTGFNPTDAEVTIAGIPSAHVQSRTTTSLTVSAHVGAGTGSRDVTVTSATDGTSAIKVNCFNVA
jgi:general secretion pathway protein G